MSPPDGAAEIRGILETTEEVNWPDPEPLFEPAEAERPYPLDALPPIIAKAVEQYQAYGQQPLPLVACSGLATSSLAAQGLAYVARDRHLTGPISFHIAAIAVSGERKTSTDRTFNKSARKWMRDRRETLQPSVDKARADFLAWQAEQNGLLSKIKNFAGRVGKEADLERHKQRLAALEAAPRRHPILPSLFHEDTNAASLAGTLPKDGLRQASGRTRPGW
jgi:hypothetical protein